jgi:hypothetical protein
MRQIAEIVFSLNRSAIYFWHLFYDAMSYSRWAVVTHSREHRLAAGRKKHLIRRWLREILEINPIWFLILIQLRRSSSLSLFARSLCQVSKLQQLFNNGSVYQLQNENEQYCLIVSARAQRRAGEIIYMCTYESIYPPRYENQPPLTVSSGFVVVSQLKLNFLFSFFSVSSLVNLSRAIWRVRFLWFHSPLRNITTHNHEMW